MASPTELAPTSGATADERPFRKLTLTVAHSQYGKRTIQPVAKIRAIFYDYRLAEQVEELTLGACRADADEVLEPIYDMLRLFQKQSNGRLFTTWSRQAESNMRHYEATIFASEIPHFRNISAGEYARQLLSWRGPTEFEPLYLLVCLMRNVQVLRVSAQSSRILDSLYNRHSANQSATKQELAKFLPNLRTIYGGGRDPFRFGLADFDHFLDLQNLHTVKVAHFFSGDTRRKMAKSVRYVQLRDMQLKEPSLPVMRYLKALERFELEVCGRSAADRLQYAARQKIVTEEVHLEAGQFLSVLDERVRHIALTVADAPNEYSFMSIGLYTAKFTHFTALQSLEVDHGFLINGMSARASVANMVRPPPMLVDLLPPSIESLHIRLQDCSNVLVESDDADKAWLTLERLFTGIIATDRGEEDALCFPNLSTVILGLTPAFVRRFGPRDLVKRLEQRGLQVRISDPKSGRYADGTRRHE